MKRLMNTLLVTSAMIALLIPGFSCTEQAWIEPQVIPESTVQVLPSDLAITEAPDMSLKGDRIAPEPVIAVYPMLLDFGNVGVSDPARRSVVIRNVGTMPLRITAIEIKAQGNAFAFYSPYPLPITVLPRPTRGVIEPPPYGSADALVYVTFDPPTLGTYSGVMYIHNTDPLTPIIRVALTGNGVLNRKGVLNTYLPQDTL